MSQPSRSSVVLNFLLVYLIWGSTYLAIKVGVADFPPFTMAATRFLIAGLTLLGIGKLRGEDALAPSDRKWAMISGCCLVLANGMVCLVETWLPSGLAAMIIGSIPAWITILHWQFFGGNRPRAGQALGILISIVGIVLLAQSDTQATAGHRVAGTFILLGSVILWSFGTLFQRKAGLLRNVFSFSGTQLSCGFLLMLAIAVIFEGPHRWAAIQLHAASVFAVFYLIVFGSIVAFSSYLWLSRHVHPTKVSTYAVVNPLVAVWLGWLVAGESITAGTLISSALVLTGIYFVLFDKKPQ